MGAPAIEELIVTTALEYMNRNTSLIKLASGSVFKVRAMNAHTTVDFVNTMSVSQMADPTGETLLLDFIKANIGFLTEKVVFPSIVEPKVPVESLLFTDVVELLGEIMNLTGLGSEQREEREGFREDSDRTEP